MNEKPWNPDENEDRVEYDDGTIMKIKYLDNGWVIETLLDHTTQRIGFTYDTEKEEVETIRNLLYEILEQLKPNSEHNPYRINILIKRQKQDV